MPTHIEFFFDISSPWTYLGFHNVQPMAARLGVPIAWRPIMVGGIFNAINPSVYASRENPVLAKAAYLKKDLQDWARQSGLKIVMPPQVFPVNSVKVMRACIWLDQQSTPRMLRFAAAAFEAYWAREEDIAQDAVVASLCAACGEDPATLLAAIGQQPIKDQLKANTDEAIRRGAFGSPSMFWGDDMYFGNDRLGLLEAAVCRAS
jgi:2-hydroxychromene-2-carboxylate isomerase